MDIIVLNPSRNISFGSNDFDFLSFVIVFIFESFVEEYCLNQISERSSNLIRKVKNNTMNSLNYIKKKSIRLLR